jgi:hypothetical protein
LASQMKPTNFLAVQVQDYLRQEHDQLYSNANMRVS